MKKLPKSFCILPWIHLEATSLGYVQPCCKSREKISDENGTPLQLSQNTLKEAWNSKQMNRLRQAFLAGDKPEGCQLCWDEEKAGIRSKRINDNEKFSSYIESFKSDELGNPVYLDLKLGNICNLKCRMCSTSSSSKWGAEEISFYDNKEDVDRRNQQGRWVRENSQFWEQLEEFLPNVKYMDFTGGEPFLIKEHFEVLKICVENGWSKNIHLHYNTNGTQFPEEAVRDIWPHFKHVEIMASIDGIGERFEYQRFPAQWDEVEENLLKFQSIPFIDFSICNTVSLLNIYYLPEFASWAKEKGFNYWYNTLHGPEWFCINQLPDQARIAVEQQIENIPLTEPLIAFMKTKPHDNLFNELPKRIQMSDLYRGQSFEKTFPEFFKIIEDSSDKPLF